MDDATNTRSRIHKVALDLFREKGYTTTTTRDVAAALGVQQPSLYNHIKNKEELLHGICFNSFSHLIASAEVAVAAVDGPYEQLRMLVRAHLASNIQYQKEFSVSVLECRSLSPEYRAQIDELWKRYSATIYGLLDTAKAANVVRNDVDNRYLYTALMDMLNWCVLWYRPGAGFTVEELDSVFFSIYMHGALPIEIRKRWKPRSIFRLSDDLLHEVTAPPHFALKQGHARLLDVASSLFAQKGYFGTSIREIAELAGLQKATLYHYVSSKEDLIYQISRSALEHLHSSVENALVQVDSPLEKVHVLITTHVLCLLQHKNWHASANDELLALAPKHREEIVARRDSYELLLRGVFQQAQDAGCLRSDVPAKMLGLVVLGMMNLIYPWYAPERDIAPGDLGELLSDLFLSGAGTRQVHDFPH